MIYDHAPIGLTFDASINSDWVAGAGGAHSTTISDPLLPGASTIVSVRLIVNNLGGGVEDYTNVAEIGSVEDPEGNDISTLDQDSTPDDTPGNDAGGEPGGDTDDTIDGENGDEDDQDPAVFEIVDMALEKELVTAGPYAVGDTVEFAITVYNQGSIPMHNVVVNDYVPAGYTFDASGVNSAWTSAGAGLYQTTISGAIAPDASEVVTISLIIEATTTPSDYVNVAELSSFEDEDGNDRSADDTDSSADDTPGNDAGGEPGGDTDGTINGENGDEDDSDPAFLERFDLALIKTLSSETIMPIIPGGTVIYDLEVFNQGTLDAFNIQLSDYTPTGLSLSDSQWDETAGVANLVTPIMSLEAGQSIVVTIMYTIDTDFMEMSITNNAEIESQEDINGPRADDDSIAGDQDGSIVDGEDNDTDETNGDDDYDPETIVVDVVDFALTKSTPAFGPFEPGVQIPFDITVYNQGTVAAAEIMIFDHIPAGLDYIDDPVLNEGWTVVNPSLLSFTHEETLDVGDSVVIRVYMTPNGNDLTLEGLTNIAEIGSVIDLVGRDISLFDQDSRPDDTVDNDEGGEFDGNTDDTVNNENGDEDDADPAPICAVVLTCPEDMRTGSCFVEPFSTPSEAGLEISCDELMVDLSFEDEVVPAECAGGDFYSERTVIRTYTYTSENGAFTQTCPQEITYEFTECNQVTDAGRIGINGESLLLIPSSGCAVPAILPIEDFVTSGCNDLVEHMWLVSTTERSNGSPFIPNPLNVGPEGSGAIWEIIDGETSESFQPSTITQNTYFVRCTRSISCCDFVETNIIGYRIDETQACPELPASSELISDCDEVIILNAIDDNMESGENIEFQTNRTIEASNKVGTGANIIYNAKQSTILDLNFEVELNGLLEIRTDGCND